MSKDPIEKMKEMEITNHGKYFTGDTSEISWILKFLSFIAFGAAVLLVLALLYQENIPALNREGYPTDVYLSAIIICLMAIPLVASFRNDEANLKGVPLDPRTDLVPDIEYHLDEILNDELCQISVAGPCVNVFDCVAVSWPIKQMAEREGLVFEPGIVFGKRTDKTFFFVDQNENTCLPKGEQS